LAILALCGCQPGGRRSEGEPNYLIVQGTDPATNAMNAYLDQSITIQFNQDIDPNTVNEGTIAVIGPRGTVNGSYVVNFSQVIFTPFQNFQANTGYTVTIAGWSANPFCVLSVMGDGLLTQYILSFQTGTQYVPDTDPPSVSEIFVSDGTDTPISLPTDNSTSITLNVSPATSIIVDFDEGMSASSFDPNTFSLIDQNNPTTPINGTFRFFNKNQRVVFFPATGGPGGFLDVASNYTLLLTSGLTDDSLNPGPNALSPAPIQVAFRTRAAWNAPSASSPYAETFSSTSMLDVNSSNAIWNASPSAQRLEGGYGAAALAGSGIDDDFAPTQNIILSTNSRPFGFQYKSVTIGQGITVTLVGQNAAILRSQGDFLLSGNAAIVADGMQGGSQPPPPAGYNQPGCPGGTPGPGGFSGGSGNPANVSVYPWRSDDGLGPSGGQGGQWTGQLWSTGVWPWNTAGQGQDIPGSGGGGGGSTPGQGGSGSNVNADGAGGIVNSVGDPQSQTFDMSQAGGCGGGGGGGTDDQIPNGAPGDQQLVFQPNGGDDGGGGGGGGGGAVNITCAQNCIISGTISANGGGGGNNCVSTVSYTSGGVGGGGGAGGCILIQALTLNISNATLRVWGGSGGQGGYTGGWWGSPQYVSRGGNGGDGYIRVESMSGTIIGETSASIQPSQTQNPACYSKGTLNINTTQGQSLFYDTLVEDPDYVDNASGGFLLNCVLNSGTIEVYVQGADADSQNEPDPQTYWPNDSTNTNPGWALIYDSQAVAPQPIYTGAINQIDRYRFIRFRVIFGNLLNVFPPGPFLTDITFPYRD
jgi:hypothetical protein